MYQKEKPMMLKSSTSAICNNLSIHVDLQKSLINYAVVHKAVVNLVSACMDGSSVNHRQVVCKEPSAAAANSMIMQAKLFPFPNRTILVMASQKGIQMYEADGIVMLYWYALEHGTANEPQATFARGLCKMGKDTICVGNHKGHILVFDIPAKGTNITLDETLKSHVAAIYDIQNSGQDNMVSSDEMGNIVLWRGGDNFTQLLKINGNGYPCNVVSYDNLIIGAFGCGHIRLFNSGSGKMVAEVDAHARWITAIDVAPSTGLIVTASEDTYVRVWKVKGGKEAKIEMKFSDSVPNLQLQGAKFLTVDGRAFGLTGYDNNEITFYKQS